MVKTEEGWYTEQPFHGDLQRLYIFINTVNLHKVSRRSLHLKKHN